MAEIVFYYDGKTITIQCNKNQKMKDICINLSNKINEDINSLVFLYGGKQLNLENIFNEITKENKINILVYKIESDIRPKNVKGIKEFNKIIDEILLLNDNLYFTLIGLKSQIDNIINDINNKKDNLHINSQLKNVGFIINSINDDIKKVKMQLNQIKNFDIPNNDYSINLNNNLNSIKANQIVENNQINSLKNEIFCVYKPSYEILLLHDYSFDIGKGYFSQEQKKWFKEIYNYINQNNIEIYVNGDKIKFTYKYKCKEKEEIIVVFKFKKLLNNAYSLFDGCSSLKAIDLSSFNTSNVNNMGCMFYKCSSLESINLSSINTSNVNNMSYMFHECSSLESIDLSSFNTSNVNNMSCMFSTCTSLESLNISSFNTNNVENMCNMFYNCSSLESINVSSSFNTINVNNMRYMFFGCNSLKSIDLSSFNTINVKDISVFLKCSSL